MSTRAPKPRRGVSAIYTIIMLVALCGLVSLGVDMGHVQVAKSELQTAADAAVRAAADDFAKSGPSAARDAAIDVAAANMCDGSPVVLDSSADIEFGTWDQANRTFTALSGSAQSSADAIRVTARRVASRNNAIPLTFARVVGRNACDVHAAAIVRVTVGSSGGFTGLGGITAKNNMLVASYNSRWTQIPTQFGAYAHGMLCSNGTIGVGKNTMVMGDIQLGPRGSVSGGPTVTGDTTRLGSPISAPVMPAWDPEPNPNGISQNYSMKGIKVLPGGTYWFTSLDIDGVLSFSGPATVYVNGDVTIDGTIMGDDFRPSNLTIYQLGTGRSFGDSKNGMLILAQVIAPGADFVTKNNLVFGGGGTFNSITTKNNALLFADEAMGAASKPIISLVK